MTFIDPLIDYEALRNDNWEDYPGMAETDLRFQLAVTLKALKHAKRLNHAIIHRMTNQNPGFIKAVIRACYSSGVARHRGRRGRELCVDLSQNYPQEIWGVVDLIEGPFLASTVAKPENRIALLLDDTGQS